MSRAPFDRLDPGGGGGSDNDENGTDNGNGDEEESVEATGSRTDFVLSEVEEQAAESEAEVEEESRTLEEEVRDAGTPGVDFRRGPSTGTTLGDRPPTVEEQIEEQRVEFADELGIDPDEIDIETREVSGTGTFQRFTEEQDFFTVSDDAQEDLFRRQLEQEYDDAEFELFREDGELRAEIREEQDGLFDDPIGVGRDIVEGTGRRVIDAPSDIRDFGQAAVDDPERAFAEGSATVAVGTEKVVAGRPQRDTIEEIDPSEFPDPVKDATKAGAAVAAVPEPTPATEAAGLTIAGGAVLTGALIQSQDGEIEITEEDFTSPGIAVPEVEVPEERSDLTEVETPDAFDDDFAEIEVPEGFERRFTEIEVPADTEFVDPTEDAVETGEAITPTPGIGPGEILTPEETIRPGEDIDEFDDREIENARRQIEDSTGEVTAGIITHLNEGATSPEVTDDFGAEAQPEVSGETAVEFDTGAVAGPEVETSPVPGAGFDSTAGVGPAVETGTVADTAFIEDVGVNVDALEIATPPAVTTGMPEEVATPEVTVPEVIEPALTGQGPGRGRRRRRGRMRLTGREFDDIEDIPDPSAAIEDEQVEFFVPDPEEVGISMEDIDDIQP